MGFQPARLKSIRSARGFTQESLGKALQIPQQQISKYESGEREPSCEVLTRMAHALDCSTDYLLDLHDHPRGNLGDRLTEEENKLLNAYLEGNSSLLFELVSKRLEQLKNDH